MEFKIWEAAQYRAANLEELEQRRADIADELVNAESEFGYEELNDEATRCMEAIDRQERAAELRVQTRKAVAGGAGIPMFSNKKEKEDRKADEDVDPLDTTEYRKAFMDYIQRGKAIPMELREVGTTSVAIADGYTQTSDVPPQVPTTMGNEIVRKMETYGNIWNKVRKLSVKGGLWFRAVELDVDASWIDETKVSNYQKVTNNDKISFSFFMLECRMSQSLLMSATTFDDFQALFSELVAKAMVKALEAAIMRGDGETQPLGILNDKRVAQKGTVIEVTKEEFGDWQKWHSAIWAKVPTAYRNGEWLMAQSTWDSYIATMADNNKAPVSIGYNPVTGDEILRIIGRSVDLVEEDIMPDFDAAKAGDVVAIFGNWNNYVVNTQPGMPMTTNKWIDRETNTEKTQCLMAVDGKVLDPYGWVLLKKKASA